MAIRLDDPRLADQAQALALAREEWAALPEHVKRASSGAVLMQAMKWVKRVERDVARLGDDPSLSSYCLTHGAPQGQCGCAAPDENEKGRAVLTAELSNTYALAHMMAEGAPPAVQRFCIAWGTAIAEWTLAQKARRPSGSGDGPHGPGCDCPDHG